MKLPPAGLSILHAPRALSTRAFWLLTWLGLALGIGMALGTGPCVDVQGVSGAAREAGFHYLLISNLGTVTMFSLLQASTSLRAQGETLAPFLLLIGCNLLNIGLNWWLIFGFEPLGIPALGAPGAAYATVTARFLGALVAGALLARRGRPQPCASPSTARPPRAGAVRLRATGSCRWTRWDRAST